MPDAAKQEAARVGHLGLVTDLRAAVTENSCKWLRQVLIEHR